MRGYLWFARRWGLRKLVTYEWHRLVLHTEIDYAQVFTTEELAVLGEHFDPAPWER